MSEIKHIPDGFSTVSAYLVVPDCKEAISFYDKAFGAQPVMEIPCPDGQGIMHAEVRIGGSTLMMSDENPNWGMISAITMDGSPVSLHLFVEDADGLFERAVDAGCQVVMPMDNSFWGDRYGKVKDPFGIEWGIASRQENLSNQEIIERAFRFMETGEM
jgi:PhnB protein